MRATISIGFYGKLPCKGDFLQRRAPQEFVDAWDPWLQECLHQSRQDLQQRWLDVYLTSPVWRFVLSEGVCGTGSYAGLMLPSVDRVGRYFPLTIIAQWNVEECPLEAAAGAQTWFDAAEQLALSALEANDLDLEAFDDQVAALTQYIDPAIGEESAYLRELLDQSNFPNEPALWHTPIPSVHAVSRAVNVLAFRELQRSLRPVALWWTEGSSAVGPSWLTTRGLPPARSFLAMMSGHWSHLGWKSLGPNRASRAAEAPAPADPAPAPEPPAAPTFIEISSCHEPISREWGAPSVGARFVERPEVGLWGVAASDPTDLKHEDAQAMADALLNVPHSGTLTALVEDVRRLLDQVQRYRATSPSAGGAALPFAASAIVFLARGQECALVYSGEVQAVRCRSASATPVVGFEPRPQGSLMDLVTGTGDADPNRSRDIIVRYETLQAGERWVIAGSPVFDLPHLPSLAAALAPHPPGSTSALAAVRATCRVRDVSTLPVLLLSANAGQQS